jgi:TetR/AcrR family transcriptional regulator, multidrug resistance operon repressor
MKKEDIFTATLSIITRQGLHATPMSQIAGESNVAIGTIYHYFKSKETLVHALYVDIHQEVEATIFPGEIDMANYEAEFSALCLRLFKFFIQNPMKFNFLQQYEHSPFGQETMELSANIEYPISAGFFDLGLKHNLLKTMPVSLLSNIVYCQVVNLVRLHLAGKVSLDKEMIQLVIEGCWGMVKK